MESYISYIVVVIVHFSSFYPLSALRFCVATTFSMMHDYAPEQCTVTGEKLTVYMFIRGIARVCQQSRTDICIQYIQYIQYRPHVIATWNV